MTSPTPPPATGDTAPRRPWWRLIGPGILVAATGVGTGDLVTGALAGGQLGVVILWAALWGAVFKFVLNEGLARWQLATGETVLEGLVRHIGRAAGSVFFVYLVIWTYTVAAALMGACGVAMHAILPLGEASTDKIIYGIAHSLIAVVLVEVGGYRLFERIMRVCIALMVVTVLVTVVLIQPDWSAVARGLVIPTLPDMDGDGLRWTIGLMGGVGGTVTVLCYGYWIREEGRESPEHLAGCRVDLAVGYVMTALFGIAMVIIGSELVDSDLAAGGKSATLLVALSQSLGDRLGPVARGVFLIGAWGAIFSSLLGVWQSVPYLYTDLLRLLGWTTPPVGDEQTTPVARTRPYRITLYLMATVPIVGMFGKFATVQLMYAVCGALFIPLLAIALLLLNGSNKYIGDTHRNGWFSTVALVMAVLIFVVYGYLELAQ